MAKIPSVPGYLTKSDIRKLVEACEKFYAIELLGEGYSGYLATRWAIPELGYNWKNSREFFRDVSRLTEQENVKGVYAVLSAWEESAPEALPPQASQEISETVPRNLKELEEALERAESEKAKAALVKNYQFYKARAPKEAPPVEPQAPASTTKEVSSPEVPPPAPQEPTGAIGVKISPDTSVSFKKFSARVATLPFRAAVSWAAPTISTQTPERAVGLYFLSRGISSDLIKDKAQAVEEKNRVRLEKLARVVKGEEIAYPAEAALLRQAFPAKDIDFLLRPESGLTQAQVSVFFNPPEKGGVSAVPKRSFLGHLLVGAGQQLFGKASAKFLQGLASRAVSKATGKAAAAVTSKGLGAIIGTAIGGPLGTAVGLVVGWITEKVIGKFFDFLRKHKNFTYALLFSPFALAGLLFGKPLLTAIGGIGIGVSLLGGAGAAVSGIGEFAGALFGSFGSIFATTIAAPVIVALISIPVLVAIILFIINSGAYVVPQKTSLVPGAIESPYIGVEKKANPPCMNREGCPGFGNVTYSVRIYAKKGTLTNVRVANIYTVISKEPKTLTPPTPDAIKNQPLTISPAQELAFNYLVPIDKSYNDSVIVDTITVTANVAEKNGEIAATSASVVVGNPQISCPVPGGRMGDGSYTPGNESRGHGSNDYWRRMGGDCQWSLPQTTGCLGPDNSGNVCSGKPPCPYYGYAEDVFPSGSNDVLAPTVLGTSTTWKYNGVHFSNGGGLAGYSYGYVDSSGKYSVLFTHIKNNAATGNIPSGGKIGELFPQGGNTHLHIEFQVNGQYQKPENFFCR